MAELVLEYLSNCFWLLVPVVLFNVMFAGRLPKEFLPDVFDKDIPHAIRWGEGIFRTLMFLMPSLMPLRIASGGHRVGALIYLAGILLYFCSWAILIAKPKTGWSRSALGFLAPAYTPIVWATGIALLGDRLFVDWFSYQWWYYIVGTLVFLGFHVTHAWIVYVREVQVVAPIET